MTRSQIRKLDQLWSQIIRSKGECEVCGKLQNECQLHPHHYIGRRNRATRWDLDNGFCICALHHTMGIESAHENPEWFRREALRLRGDKWLKEIYRKSNQIFKKTFEQIYKELKKYDRTKY
jgi:hypothetical protein